jgi:hypothetical protein
MRVEVRLPRVEPEKRMVALCECIWDGGLEALPSVPGFLYGQEEVTEGEWTSFVARGGSWRRRCLGICREKRLRLKRQIGRRGQSPVVLLVCYRATQNKGQSQALPLPVAPDWIRTSTPRKAQALNLPRMPIPPPGLARYYTLTT